MLRISKLIVVIILIGAAITGVVLGSRWIHRDSTPEATVTLESPAVVVSQPAADIPGLLAQDAVVIQSDNGDIIYARNAQNRAYPASTTKIMTALLVIENCSMDESTTVGEEVQLVAPQSSKAGLMPGDRLSIQELLNALMVPSGNDAAYTLAVYVARKENPGQQLSNRAALDVFSDMMNQRAQALGALESHFVNPDGYHNAQHYSTALDLAFIAREAMKHASFQKVVGLASCQVQISGARGAQRTLRWENTNEMIDPQSPAYFQEATGVKTGHTTEAGYCLVSSGTRDQHNVIAVALNSSKDGVFSDSSSLLNYGFANFPVAQVGREGIETYKTFFDYKQWQVYAGVLVLTALYIGVRVAGHRKRQNSNIYVKSKI